MEIILCLHNIRSTYNVGAILRTADGFGIERAILSGYTPSPLNPTTLPHVAAKIGRQIEKTALGAESTVPQEWSNDLSEAIKQYKTDGYQIIGLENNVPGNQKVYQFGTPEFKAELAEKVVLILGEEVHGIPQEYYDQIDLFAEIPMVGTKESFNVSVAASIAMYALKIEH